MTCDYELVSEEPLDAEGDRPITFAHRGARLDEPENTIPAFARALAAGASGLETDVWRAADGEEAARGTGTFMRSHIPLSSLDGYRSA